MDHASNHDASPEGRPKKKTGKATAGKRRRRLVTPVVAGWREWVALPDLGVEFIKAKLDTGARTSALHAFRLQPFERDGATWVRFELHPVQRDNSVRVPCEAPVVARRKVRSTSGHVDERWVIRTRVALGGHRRTIEVTLTNRDPMGFRMLLGRTAMRRWIVVDPSRSYQLGPDRDGMVDAPRTRRKKRKKTKTAGADAGRDAQALGAHPGERRGT